MEHSGFRVTVSLDLEETKRLLAAEMFDLFILCHSLSFLDSEKALTLAHRLRPGMKNLILATDFSGRSDDASDTVLTAFCSPQALISKAASLTAHVASNP